MSSLSEPRRKVQLANIIQILKEKLKLATTYMPRGRKPEAERALSNAERQAHYRARRQAQQPQAAIRRRPAADRRSRAQRWRDAIAELLALQAEYAARSDALPESLRDSATAEALQEIVDLDLDPLADIRPPRGFGRD